MSAAVPVSFTVRRNIAVGSLTTFRLNSRANAFTFLMASGSPPWCFLYSVRPTRTGPLARPPLRFTFSGSLRFTITDTVTNDLAGVAFTGTALGAGAFSLPGRTRRVCSANRGGLTGADCVRGDLFITDLFLAQASISGPGPDDFE